ncbi:MAG: hypothetical protein VYB54_17175 [Pseudomonadota bacterium]|nr:hypothetical protein [Pseudomonadota bacterium]
MVDWSMIGAAVIAVLIAAVLAFFMFSSSGRTLSDRGSRFRRDDAHRDGTAPGIGRVAGRPATVPDHARAGGSRVTATRNMDRLVFQFRNGNRQLADLVKLLFICFWLTGWTAGILFASVALIASISGDGDIVDGLFLTVWLTIAIIGEVFVLRHLVGLVAAFFGTTVLAVDRNGLAVTHMAGPFRQTRSHPWAGVTNLRADPAGLAFTEGRKMVTIGGVTRDEAGRIVHEINEFRHYRDRSA